MEHHTCSFAHTTGGLHAAQTANPFPPAETKSSFQLQTPAFWRPSIAAGSVTRWAEQVQNESFALERLEQH
eukprot:870918-Prymnesium_polylepis.1